MGTSGLVIDFGVTYLLKDRLGWQKYLANASGFTLAATNNFCWNKIWTFQDTNSMVMEQYFTFMAVALVGLGINTLAIMIGDRYLKIKFYPAKMIGIGVVVIWNFTMNYYLTF